MIKLEIQTDSNGLSVIELLNLKEEDFKNILELMNSNQDKSIGYKYKSQTGAIIQWVDRKRRSICILIRHFDDGSFIKHLENKLNS